MTHGGNNYLYLYHQDSCVEQQPSYYSPSIGKFLSESYDSKHLAQCQKKVKISQCSTVFRGNGIIVIWTQFLRHLWKSFTLVWKDRVIIKSIETRGEKKTKHLRHGKNREEAWSRAAKGLWGPEWAQTKL